MAFKDPVRERDIEKYLREQVKAIGGKAYKWESPGNNGVPDRIVCLPGGIKLFVELKAPGKKPTDLQAKRQNELVKLGNYVFNIDSKHLVNEFIKNCKVLMGR